MIPHYSRFWQGKMEESVATILFDSEKKKVLLIKRRDIPVWVLPGGGIEPGETPSEAALRESEEETRCKCSLVRKIAFYLPANRITKPTHFFECSLLSGTPTIGAETADVAFFPLDALPKLLVPFYRTWIADALVNAPEVLQKTIEKTSYLTFCHYLITHPLLVSRFLLTRVGIHLNAKPRSKL